ncbi:MAG TPA: class II aldolase/adducin family protein [Candidatus Binatia bacterium]|nr:class II aldolase/adducin family protein [Candidatus Binatia bacterium]
MTKLEREMIYWGKLLFERRLISGWGGNLSCRIGKNRFLITGQHAPLGFLTSKDLVRIDQNGKPATKNQRASSETPMHMAVYQGTDAQAIVHVHPPMVLAFSLTHESFVPVSFEEKYTIGEVPIVAQGTPTVTRPEKVVEALKYRPVVIIKGHGTVAIGKTFQEAFLFTDLLEEAVHCQFFKKGVVATPPAEAAATRSKNGKADVQPAASQTYPLFSREHMTALVESANSDIDFRKYGGETGLSTSLTLHMEENNSSWTVTFIDGEITELNQQDQGDFVISGQAEWWDAVFQNRIDAFLATQQGKLKLKRGELAQLSRWYKPFQRAFAIWQTIPIR